MKGPQDEFFRVLRERLGDLPIIAEDLGMITPEVHALRERLAIPGMKVLQFAFGNPGAHIYLPHNFQQNCVVYSGTHDNDTTVGWWQSGASQEERTQAQAYLGRSQDNIAWTFIRAAWDSVARLAIVPLQDVLGLGSEARMNIPSHLTGNWGWRFPAGALRPDLADRLAALTTVCDRAPAASTGKQRDREVGEDFAA
jgi:4-alpha-glucanotransferase